MERKLILALMVSALSACGYEGSGVQKDYVADRAECREYAEYTVGREGRIDDPANLDLVRQFARCMHKRGWAVNKPPEEKRDDDDDDE